MKKSIICLLALAFCGVNGFAQRGDLVPLKATYHTAEEGMMMLQDDFTYDEYEFYLMEKFTTIEDVVGHWVNYARETYEYEFDENPVSILTEHWDGYEEGEWVNDQLATLSYIDVGMESKVKEKLVKTWENGAWTNLHWYFYDYEPIHTIMIKDWIGTQWENHLLYTIEENGDETVVLVQYWQGGAWQNMEKHTYHYDSNHYLKDITKMLFVGGAWAPTQTKTVTYTNDEQGNTLNAICESSYGGLYEQNTDIEIFFGEGKSILYPHIKEINVQYFDVTNVAENTVEPQFTLYPNPAKDRFTVQGADFHKAEVYNLSGQKVLESNTPEIQFNNMAAGAYLVKVFRSNGLVETHKLMH